MAPIKIPVNPKQPTRQVRQFSSKYISTGINGFDNMIEGGIPKGSKIVVTGGPGSGKTLFCLNTAYNAAVNGETALYVSFEEHEEKLRQYMRNFGWNIDELEKRGWIRIIRIDPFIVSRKVEALFAKSSGELSIDENEVGELIPIAQFEPSVIIFDSLSALEAAFFDKDKNYRILAEHLFRYLEQTNATSFLITEGNYNPQVHAKSTIEEFMADGVTAMYNIQQGNTRVRALEILKLRGVKHVRKIVPFDINKGIIVYPNEPTFFGE